VKASILLVKCVASSLLQLLNTGNEVSGKSFSCDLSRFEFLISRKLSLHQVTECLRDLQKKLFKSKVFGEKSNQVRHPKIKNL